MVSVESTYAMLGNESLWDAAKTAHRLLDESRVAHAVLGGVAVCLHGYQRNTVDIDMIVRQEDVKTARIALEAAGWIWDEDRKECRSPSGVPVQFLLSGDPAGRGSEVKIPDPSEAAAVTEFEGLPALSLACLIETKIACGEGNLRRTHKDFADVVELIAAHDLSRSFARHLHKSVRRTFRELVLRARGV